MILLERSSESKNWVTENSGYINCIPIYARCHSYKFGNIYRLQNQWKNRGGNCHDRGYIAFFLMITFIAMFFRKYKMHLL